MKKNKVTISFTFEAASTTNSIDDAIGQEIHQIESASEAIETMRETLRAFVKENREAIDIDAVTSTLKANGYSKQRISDLLRSYGITRRAPSKSRAASSKKIDAMLPMAEAALLKLVGGDRKLYRAVITRLFRK